MTEPRRLFRRRSALQAPLVMIGVNPVCLELLVRLGPSASWAPMELDVGSGNVEVVSAAGAVEDVDGLDDVDLVNLGRGARTRTPPARAGRATRGGDR